MTLTIIGLQEIQKANLKMIEVVKPTGGLGRAIKYVTPIAERYAVAISDVDTGAMRASHRIKVESEARYRIYLDPSSVNPRGQRPAEYGEYVHNMGGSHSFYERTVDERGNYIGQRAMKYLESELP